MLYRTKELKGYQLGATDGDIGKVTDFLFDDQFWTVRYLIAETGTWLLQRPVLISPHSLKEVRAGAKEIMTDLARQQVEDSPPLESDLPVSRQYERKYYAYYGWSSYWYGPYPWGAYYYPVNEAQLEPPESGEDEGKKWDSHLRSIKEVEGYNIHTADGDIGHISDFILDGGTWAIRYLVADTANLWPGKHVLLSPHWIVQVSWADREVDTDLTRETIKQAPEYRKDTEINREYEQQLYSYYQREGYWAREHPGNH